MLEFTLREWRQLENSVLLTHDLPDDQVAGVLSIKREHGRLTANDRIALVTAGRTTFFLPETVCPAGSRRRAARGCMACSGLSTN